MLNIHYFMVRKKIIKQSLSKKIITDYPLAKWDPVSQVHCSGQSRAARGGISAAEPRTVNRRAAFTEATIQCPQDVQEVAATGTRVTPARTHCAAPQSSVTLSGTEDEAHQPCWLADSRLLLKERSAWPASE